LSDVSVDNSSDILAYSAATCYSIFDVANATAFYCITFQTVYDMANDNTLCDFNSSSWLPY